MTWGKLGRTSKWLMIVVTLLSSISFIGGKYILPAIKITQIHAGLPTLIELVEQRLSYRIDSLAKEVRGGERVDSSLHNDLMFTEYGVEGIWAMVMARTEPHDEKDYEMVLSGNDTGSAVDVFLRDDDSRPPQVWAFWKVCGMSEELKGHCHYYVLQANWSPGYRKYYISDFYGDEIVIKEKR